MQLFNDFLKKSKALCDQLGASMFDSNNTETAVEQLLKSTEINTSAFSEENKHLVDNQPLYNAPNDDYYMESPETKTLQEPEESKMEIHRDIQTVCLKEHITEDVVQDDNCDNKLIFEISNLLEELKQLSQQTEDANAVSAITFCENRIIEILLSCGCKSIDMDSVFDNSRHVPQPFSFVQNGCAINKIIKPGLSYKNKVLVKAIVDCEK